MRRVTAWLLILITTLGAFACAKADANIAEIVISLAGDCTLAADEPLHGSPDSFVGVMNAMGNDYGYPLALAQDLFSNDDYTLVNLECVLTDQWQLRNTSLYLNFRGPASYVNILTQGSVEGVSMSNNHALDYGIDGLRDCQRILTDAGVQWAYNNNYFKDRWQGIPMGGYNQIIDRLLEGVEVKLGVDYDTNRDAFRDAAPTVLYTGQIDAYFGYRLGNLEYRGLRFETERLEKENYQGVACMNFTAREVPYTRIIEHKHFEFGTQPVTYITREYPSDWKPGDEAYYPVNNEANQKLYKAYQELAATEKNVIFGGRLGEYKYYDMDKVIESALNMCERVFG